MSDTTNALDDDLTPEPVGLYDDAESQFGMIKYDYQDPANRLGDYHGLTPEAKREHMLEAHYAMQDAKVGVEGKVFYGQLVNATIQPPDEATMQQEMVEARRTARERWGDEGAKRLAEAQKFVAARSHLGPLATNAKFLIAIAANIHSVRMQPRPRKAKG